MRQTGFSFTASVLVALLVQYASFASDETSPSPAVEAQAGKPAFHDPDRPPPPMPLDAILLQDFAPFELTITADRDGAIKKVEVSKPTKPKSYHLYIRDWVEAHWKMPAARPQEPELRKFIAPIAFDKKSIPKDKLPDPVYPKDFLVQQISGSVEMEMEVTPSGSIRAVNVVRSSHNKRLDDYAAAWVKVMWRFPQGYEGVYYHKIIFVIR